MSDQYYRLCKACKTPNDAKAQVCSNCKTPMPPKAQIFISYSHKDKKYLQKLLTHLSALKRSEQVEEWSDRNIDAGQEWAKEIDTSMQTADVILLLVSASFLNSDYCYSLEGKYALERHRAKNACVIPVLLRPVVWEDTPLHDLQAVPRGLRAIQSWGDDDAAFVNVIQELKTAIANRYGIVPQRPKI